MATLLKRIFISWVLGVRKRVNIARPRQLMLRVVILQSSPQLASGNLDLQRLPTTQTVKRVTHYA